MAQLLLSNLRSDQGEWSIRLDGAPDREVEITCSVIDESRDLAQTPGQASVHGKLLTVKVPSLTVCLVALRS